MRPLVRGLADVPLVPRCMIIGMALLGIPGAVWGLLAGIGQSPVIWVFAVFEGGILAGFAGALVGSLVGLLAFAAASVKRSGRRRARTTRA